MSAIPQFRQFDEQPEDSPTEQQIRESQKMEAIGRLVGGVAHDFNNLLTGMVLSAELILLGLETENRLRHYAEEIRSAGAQGGALIKQLLTVAGQRPAAPTLLSVNEIIAGMRNLLARLIGENIELSTDLATGLGLLRMDPAQVQQIILNLVLNARDAMPDGGKIALSTRNCQEWTGKSNEPKLLARCVEFVVRDTGCGMDEQTRARLFEPFFTTKKPGRGTGLGLATVNSIVGHEGGSIKVESQPGKGTQITIYLPRAEPEESQIAVGPANAAEKNPQSKRGHER